MDFSELIVLGFLEYEGLLALGLTTLLTDRVSGSLS
jgi:hypothetical protein